MIPRHIHLSQSLPRNLIAGGRLCTRVCHAQEPLAFRNLPNHFVRAYSPVRSRLPRTPPPPPSSRARRPQVFINDNSTDEPYDRIEAASTYSGIIQPSDAVAEILSQPTLAIERRLELMNVVFGFEQANRYNILDANGNYLGHMEEEDFGIGKAIMRQIYRLHRPFVVRVYNRHDEHCLTIRRPFSFINSHIKAILPTSTRNPEPGPYATYYQAESRNSGAHNAYPQANDTVIGETKQQWHLWRRKYNLFLKNSNESDDTYDQFGQVDAPFLSFQFPVKNEAGHVMGAVDRNWVGLGRELFTDTGVYILRMDPSSFYELGDIYPTIAGPLTMDQRAVMLGTAVSIDFDYFSRHSNRGGFVGFSDYE